MRLEQKMQYCVCKSNYSEEELKINCTNVIIILCILGSTHVDVVQVVT